MSELSDRIKDTIESEDVVLFMKGTPQQVLCGNSARALDALRAVGASVTAVDVLPDPAIRQELSALSSWPTIPQVFVRGELVGGADIVEELAASGELRAKLDTELGEGWPTDERSERVVELTDGGSRLRLVP
jgi:monothiol glutaredoxin